jgi:hypothetical protein
MAAGNRLSFGDHSLIGVESRQEPSFAAASGWGDNRCENVTQTRVAAPAPRAAIGAYRLDPWSGRRELWKEIAPISPSTGGGIGSIRFAADGKICAYTHLRYTAEILVADGLQ